jgi:hypothetical protein
MATEPKTRSTQRGAAFSENAKNGKPVSLDLDAYEAEANREPFIFTLGGSRFEMPHMGDLDWHTQLGPDGTPDGLNVRDLLRAGLGTQWAQFDSLNLSGGGWNKLFESWMKHSGTDAGEGGASQP